MHVLTIAVSLVFTARSSCSRLIVCHCWRTSNCRLSTEPRVINGITEQVSQDQMSRVEKNEAHWARYSHYMHDTKISSRNKPPRTTLACNKVTENWDSVAKDDQRPWCLNITLSLVNIELRFEERWTFWIKGNSVLIQGHVTCCWRSIQVELAVLLKRFSEDLMMNRDRTWQQPRQH